MKPLRLLVIADPAAPWLHHLDRLRTQNELAVGLTAHDLRGAAPRADAVFIGTGRGDVLAELWPELTNLRWVHSMATGLENVLFPELVESEIPLTNSRGVFRESLGEFTIAAILFFAKDLRRMVKAQEQRRWEAFDVDEIYRQTLAVVGYGEIGRAAARRAHALGMRVVAMRRRPDLSANDELLAEAFSPDRRAEMMAMADYVLIASPLTPQTRGLVGFQEIAAMKSSAVLINVGRGPVVDEVALIGALQNKKIRGAALDVFDEEPLPDGHPFWRMDNVLLSPHTADHTRTWLEEAADFFVQNVERYRSGQPLENVVDKRAGY